MKTLLLIWALTTASIVYACPSQIITLPDGRQMVCFYCNGGKIVDCSYL